MNIEKLGVEIAETTWLFGARRRKRAAERLAGLATPHSARILAEAFVRNTDQRVVDIARHALETSHDQAVIDSAAGVALLTGDEELAALIVGAPASPSDPGHRAVVLFLAGEFARYEGLDFDGALLRTARTVGSEVLRRRLATKARTAGRLDWARTVLDTRDLGQVPLSRAEWDAAVDILTDPGLWEELPRLAPQAPASWLAPVLRDVGRAGWWPASDTERATFTELIGLATNACAREAPTTSTFGDENPTTIQVDGDVRNIGVARDGQLLLTFTGKMLGQIWRIQTDGNAGPLADGSRYVTSMAMTSDGELLATGEIAGIQLWRFPPGTPAGELIDHGGPAHGVTITPVGQFLASYWSGKVQVWDLASRTTINTVKVDQPRNPFALTPDGKLLVSGEDRGTMRLWRLADGTPIRTLRGHSIGVGALTITPDGGLLASGGFDRTIRLWHLPSGEPVGMLRVPSAVLALAVSPDGALLVSAGSDAIVRLWHLPSGEPAGELVGHTGRIQCLAMSPDGRLLASGSENGSILCWRRSELAVLTHTPLAEVKPAQIQDLRQSSHEFSADERAWFDLLEALTRWRTRHDIELTDPTATTEAAAWDIELDEASDKQTAAHKPRQRKPKRKAKRKRTR